MYKKDDKININMIIIYVGYVRGSEKSELRLGVGKRKNKTAILSQTVDRGEQAKRLLVVPHP
jgi:hypothetical protein